PAARGTPGDRPQLGRPAAAGEPAAQRVPHGVNLRRPKEARFRHATEYGRDPIGPASRRGAPAIPRGAGADPGDPLTARFLPGVGEDSQRAAQTPRSNFPNNFRDSPAMRSIAAPAGGLRPYGGRDRVVI